MHCLKKDRELKEYWNRQRYGVAILHDDSLGWIVKLHSLFISANWFYDYECFYKWMVAVREDIYPLPPDGAIRSITDFERLETLPDLSKWAES
jgi:hypothetical protein